MKNNKLTRRDFIKKAAFAGAGLAVGGGLLTRLDALAQGPKIYLPLIFKAPSPSKRVVHVHDSDATYWDFGGNYYGNYVSQDVVNNMVDQGVMTLTGIGSVNQAWQSLIPDYALGKAIAIKANLNNAFQCDDSDTDIDALIHLVNAIVRGLKQTGVAEGDIWVYEAVRRIPDRFANGCLYSGVQFFGGCSTKAGFDSSDPNAYVTFTPPSGVPVPPTTKITDVLIGATYLINMPIMKKHSLAGMSLSFKNHFGTINNPDGSHSYIDLSGSYFNKYSPFVDIYKNPHIKDKTILTVGDGLFGCIHYHDSPPARWITFSNQAPNSLFFATDPVAIDCVMCDFLTAEAGIPSGSDYYLQLAAAAGLGAFERGNPWGSGYNIIDYVKLEL